MPQTNENYESEAFIHPQSTEEYSNLKNETEKLKQEVIKVKKEMHTYTIDELFWQEMDGARKGEYIAQTLFDNDLGISVIPCRKGTADHLNMDIPEDRYDFDRMNFDVEVAVIDSKGKIKYDHADISQEVEVLSLDEANNFMQEVQERPKEKGGYYLEASQYMRITEGKRDFTYIPKILREDNIEKIHEKKEAIRARLHNDGNETSSEYIKNISNHKIKYLQLSSLVAPIEEALVFGNSDLISFRFNQLDSDNILVESIPGTSYDEKAQTQPQHYPYTALGLAVEAACIVDPYAQKKALKKAVITNIKDWLSKGSIKDKIKNAAEHYNFIRRAVSSLKKRDDFGSIKLLLDNKHDINKMTYNHFGKNMTDKHPLTPLDIAVLHNNEKLAKFLINKGARASQCSLAFARHHKNNNLENIITKDLIEQNTWIRILEEQEKRSQAKKRYFELSKHIKRREEVLNKAKHLSSESTNHSNKEQLLESTMNRVKSKLSQKEPPEQIKFGEKIKIRERAKLFDEHQTTVSDIEELSINFLPKLTLGGEYELDLQDYQNKLSQLKDGEEIHIGRGYSKDSKNTILLPPGKGLEFVSKDHLTIISRGDGRFDLKSHSTNGTEIQYPNKERPSRPEGDRPAIVSELGSIINLRKMNTSSR